jgi:replicative DNA helicase
VAKNRSGPVGTVELAFNRQSMRFDLLARGDMGGY